MKKTLAIVLALATVLSLSVVCFAADSPSRSNDESTYVAPAATKAVKYTITDVADASKLSAEDKAALEKAYEEAKADTEHTVLDIFFLALEDAEAKVEFNVGEVADPSTIVVTVNGEEVPAEDITYANGILTVRFTKGGVVVIKAAA